MYGLGSGLGKRQGFGIDSALEEMGVKRKRSASHSVGFCYCEMMGQRTGYAL